MADLNTHNLEVQKTSPLKSLGIAVFIIIFCSLLYIVWYITREPSLEEYLSEGLKPEQYLSYAEHLFEEEHYLLADSVLSFIPRDSKDYEEVKELKSRFAISYAEDLFKKKLYLLADSVLSFIPRDSKDYEEVKELKSRYTIDLSMPSSLIGDIYHGGHGTWNTYRIDYRLDIDTLTRQSPSQSVLRGRLSLTDRWMNPGFTQYVSLSIDTERNHIRVGSSVLGDYVTLEPDGNELRVYQDGEYTFSFKEVGDATR